MFFSSSTPMCLSRTLTHPDDLAIETKRQSQSLMQSPSKGVGRIFRWAIFLLLGLVFFLGSLLLASRPALAVQPTLLAQDFLSLGASPFELGGLHRQQLISAIAWIDSLGPIGYFAFICMYVAVTVAFLPASMMTLGADLVFGVVKGSLLVFVGAMLGATAAFLVGRFIARDWIEKKVTENRFFSALDDAIAQEGTKLVFLLHLSPLFPFTLLNYALGLTKVSLPSYVIGTTGIIPGTILYVYLGSLISDIALIGTGQLPESSTIEWIFKALILVTGVAITLYTTKIARQALKAAISPQPTSDCSQKKDTVSCVLL